MIQHMIYLDLLDPFTSFKSIKAKKALPFQRLKFLFLLPLSSFKKASPTYQHIRIQLLLHQFSSMNHWKSVPPLKEITFKSFLNVHAVKLNRITSKDCLIKTNLIQLSKFYKLHPHITSPLPQGFKCNRNIIHYQTEVFHEIFIQ